jgi:hypothetical protein
MRKWKNPLILAIFACWKLPMKHGLDCIRKTRTGLDSKICKSRTQKSVKQGIDFRATATRKVYIIPYDKVDFRLRMREKRKRGVHVSAG